MPDGVLLAISDGPLVPLPTVRFTAASISSSRPPRVVITGSWVENGWESRGASAMQREYSASMTNLAVQLADSVKSFGVKAVYGDSVQLDGSTIVPVALAYYGFGGGSDTQDDNGNVAGGGGGGGATIPIGAYVSRAGEAARFEPNIIALIVVSIPATWVAGKALSRVIRALKK